MMNYWRIETNWNVSINNVICIFNTISDLDDFSEHPESVEAKAGDKVTFSCQPPMGLPVPMVTYFLLYKI